MVSEEAKRGLYRAIYNFQKKYYKCRDINVKTRSYCGMWCEGRPISDIPRENRPSDVARAYAELELAQYYVCWEDMTPMKRDYLKLLDMFRRVVPSGRCTYRVCGFFNKKYENGTEAGIIMNAVDETSCYFEEFYNR